MIQVEELTDVTYEVDRGLAWITINRPDRFNAFRGRTVDEMVSCFSRAWSDRSVGVVAETRRSAPAATPSSGPRPGTTGRR
jgi:naphthoate synthase